MSPAKKRNTGHSVFQRLLNHAKAHCEDFNVLLSSYLCLWLYLLLL